MSEFVTVKAEDLAGAALDWAVAKAQDLNAEVVGGEIYLPNSSGEHARLYQPSTDWAQGGPLIDRFGVQICPPESAVHRNGGPNAGWGESGYWSATIFRKGEHRRRVFFVGEPLVLAMRAVVAFHCGDTVQVPAALLEVAHA